MSEERRGRIKVLQVQGYSPSAWGGNVEHVSLLARFLDPRRFDVTVAAQKGSGYISRYRALGLKVHEFSLGSKYDVPAFLKIYYFLARERFDVVHTHLRNVDFAFGMAAALARVPVRVCTLHGRLNVLADGSRSSGVSDAVYACVLRRLFHVVAAVSEGTRQDAVRLIGLDPRKTRTITNGIDITKLLITRPRGEIRRELGLKKDDFLVGTVCRITEPNKGNIYLLEAVRRLAPDLPTLHLAIVGDGPSRDLIARKISEMEIAHRVHLVGWRSDVANYANAFDIFVLPSLAEGMPRALMEAMYLGVPVVATQIDGVPEAVQEGETGLLVPVKDPEAIARAVRQLVTSSELRARLAKAGQERIRRSFTHERMVRETEALYEELLARKVLRKTLPNYTSSPS